MDAGSGGGGGQQQLLALKKELKSWERMFERKHRRKPTKVLHACVDHSCMVIHTGTHANAKG